MVQSTNLVVWAYLYQQATKRSTKSMFQHSVQRYDPWCETERFEIYSTPLPTVAIHKFYSHTTYNNPKLTQVSIFLKYTFCNYINDVKIICNVYCTKMFIGTYVYASCCCVKWSTCGEMVYVRKTCSTQLLDRYLSVWLIGFVCVFVKCHCVYFFFVCN